MFSRTSHCTCFSYSNWNNQDHNGQSRSTLSFFTWSALTVGQKAASSSSLSLASPEAPLRIGRRRTVITHTEWKRLHVSKSVVNTGRREWANERQSGRTATKLWSWGWQGKHVLLHTLILTLVVYGLGHHVAFDAEVQPLQGRLQPLTHARPQLMIHRQRTQQHAPHWKHSQRFILQRKCVFPGVSNVSQISHIMIFQDISKINNKWIMIYKLTIVFNHQKDSSRCI